MKALSFPVRGVHGPFTEHRPAGDSWLDSECRDKKTDCEGMPDLISEMKEDMSAFQWLGLWTREPMKLLFRPIICMVVLILIFTVITRMLWLKTCSPGTVNLTKNLWLHKLHGENPLL